MMTDAGKVFEDADSDMSVGDDGHDKALSQKDSSGLLGDKEKKGLK